jgi:hypothetical protein
MYCKNCGKEIEIVKGQQIRCAECELLFQTRFQRPGKKEPAICYCIECGEPLPINTITDINGITYQRYGNRNKCETCDRAPKCTNTKEPHPRPLPIRNQQSKVAHINAVKRWAENNPEKVRASSRVRYRKDMANIIYECRCDHPNKVFHHFDYSKPYDVILLCPECHRIEHRRLKNLEQPCNSKCS